MTLIDLQREIDNSMFSPDCWLKSQILYREAQREQIYDEFGKGTRTQKQFAVGRRDGRVGQRNIPSNSKASHVYAGTVKGYSERD